MDKEYYYYCFKCEDSSEIIGVNNAVKCANFLVKSLKFIRDSIHGIKLLESFKDFPDSEGLNIKEATIFFKKHLLCSYCFEYFLIFRKGGSGKSPEYVKENF